MRSGIILVWTVYFRVLTVLTVLTVVDCGGLWVLGYPVMGYNSSRGYNYSKYGTSKLYKKEGCSASTFHFLLREDV